MLPFLDCSALQGSESVKCRFSKCRFSTELEKVEKKLFKMGGSVEK